jgi:putative transcriptional regulator
MVELNVKREDVLTNSIDPALRSKEVLKTALIVQIIVAFIFFNVWPIMWGISVEEGVPLDIVLLSIISIVIWGGLMLIVCGAQSLYSAAFIRSFRYGVTADSIVIQSGVFTKDTSTIPFSRIQNIKITHGVFDRRYGLFTVKVETAGFSGPAQGGGQHRAEGYLPGLRDPHVLEQKMKEQIAKFSRIPSGLEDKVFASKDIAFDNFISYIISKMTDGAGLKTRIAEYRDKKGWSQERLADEVGASVEAIKFLEDGRYNPSLSLAYAIAKVLGTRVEDLFVFGG